MSDITLSVLKPSVNNLTVRIFVRAAGLDFEEVDVWGKTAEPGFLVKNPAHLTPMLEEQGLPRTSLWESCAIMQYLCNTRGLTQFYPEEPARRAMVDSAMFYLIGTLYPLLQQAAEAALAEPLDVYRAFYLDGKQFIGGDHPSIADIRLAASLEFLAGIDYDLPAWAKEYMAAMQSALGDAYAEPAADVRGFIAMVKAPA